jgi:hypothetical protein
VFLTHDVIHFAAKEGIVFMNQTILAEEICPHGYQPS